LDNKAGRTPLTNATNPAPQGNNHLLAIGIDAYRHCPPLRNCVKDVQDFITVVQQRFNFDAAHTYPPLFNTGATRKNILKAFRDVQGRIKPQDNLVVYFSGHGDTVHQLGYWIPVEANPGEEDEYISAHEIVERLNAIPTFHTFLIVDACFSGSLFQNTKNVAIPKRSDEAHRSRWGLTASHSRELALDGTAGDNSPFAECLLAKLRQTPEALSVHDLSSFVINEVRRRTEERQTPIAQPLPVRGHELGQFVFHLRNDEESDWMAVQVENIIAAYSRYRRTYPNGKYYTAANQKIKALEEEEDWQKALRWNKTSYYEDYLEEYPNGKYAAEAREHIDAILTKIILPEPPKLIVPEGLILVEGGTFQMGSNKNDNEKPIHEVKLDSFYIGKYPVTFEAYDAFCAATQRDKPGDQDWGRARRPVTDVSWYDAVAYCNWLSAQQNLQQVYTINGKDVGVNWRAKGYRLPTEAEWEYAARGGKKRNGFEYAGSNNLDEVGWYDGNSKTTPHPVGNKKANELGIHDMSGNVWEWCNDWYAAYPASAQTNPQGPDKGSYRVFRGGSWRYDAQCCRAAGRYGYTPTYRYDFIGFRLAL